MNLSIVQGYVSSFILLLLSAGIVAEFYNSRRLKRPIRVITAIWLTHGVIYYSAVLTARWFGVRVDNTLATEIFTLWSSVLRIHFVLTIILYNNIVDYLTIRESRRSE